MGTSVEISYGLFDVTAKEDSAPAITDKQSFINLDQLKQTDLQVEKYGTGEHNQFILDGTFKLFPDNPEEVNFGLWSLSMSDSTGVFSVPPIMTIIFTANHSSLGLTFFFSKATDDYCSSMNVKWYDSANALLLDKDFTPDSAVYFAEGQVENYKKVVITFHATNRPYRYLKLSEIKYGQLKVFGSGSILSASILEEVDPLSSEISINTLEFKVYTSDFEILNMQGIYSLLQQKQKVNVVEYVNGVEKKMGTFYFDEPESDTDKTTTISCIDLIGVIDQTDFKGGMYFNALVTSILDEIMTSAKAEYELDSSFSGVALSGYIPICSHREALQQLAIAIGAIVDCSRDNKIKLYPMPTASSATIGYGKKLDGHKLKLRALVTGVEVTAHNYTVTSESQELLNSTLAIGTYVITFDSPMHSLVISGGTIAASNANYAVISVTVAGAVILTGNTYNDSTRVFGSYMPDLPANEKTNVIKVEEATLISNSNAQATADRMYNYYQNRHQDEGPIILGDEEPGIIVTMDSLNNKQIEGIIESMDIDLAGGFIADIKVTGKAVV